MLKKNKKFTLLLSGLSGVLLTSSIAGVALTSCTTTSTSSSDVQYSYVIDWNNKDAVDRLIIDNDGLVYSDNAKTTLIAISPKVKLTTIKIPSRVKSIMGYSKVMYRNSSGALLDQIPSGGSESDYTKVYQSVGAFQDMVSLETVVLESGSQLKSIGGLAFSGCTTLKTISGLSNSLDYIGTNAFTNCINLASIDTTNVIKVGDNAFSGCVSLGSVSLSNAIYIGNSAFENCSSLSSIGSLEKAKSIGTSAFSGAIKSGASVSLKLTNLVQIPESAFTGVQGISKIDLSGNTLLTSIGHDAFQGSSITEVDLTGCSRLTTIDYNAFKDCSSLTTVSLPSNDATRLTTIGSNAFLNCSSLTTVAAKGSTGFVATNKLTSLGANFLGNTAITSLDLTNFTIGSSNSSTTPFGSTTSLAYITNLNSVTLPSTLTTLNAGLFYNSGIGTTGGFSLDLPSTITNIEYNNSLSISDATTSETSTIADITVSNATPFTNSGLTSIDMSKITSYQSTSGSTMAIPSYLFNGNAKLTSVILKTGTTAIGDYAFQGTTALTSITYPATSDAETVAETTSGFTAASDLTTIGTGAFYGAFSATSDITVDLTIMNNSANTNAPIAFSNSNVVNLKLPTNIVTIQGNSFDNMTRLASVNFADLTALTTIYKSNFTNTQLTSIDLSKTQFQTITGYSVSGSSGELFTGLPSTCVVSLPNTIGSFSNVFMDTNNNPVTFNYPNGLKIDTNLINISSGVLTFSTTNQQLSNISSIDLSSNSTVYSIGQNTFFGNNKLSTVNLKATGISNTTWKSLFYSSSSSIVTNTVNTSSSSSYSKDKVSFGSNESFTSLNYKNFTVESTASVDETSRASGDEQKALFNTTNNTTWAEVAKIINSLSYQKSPTQASEVASLKANMSEWPTSVTSTDNTNGAAINTDAAQTFTTSTSSVEGKVVLTNSYSGQSDTSVTINASDTSKTFVHNGITWTYTNDGSTIKLVGSVNMYKLGSNTSNKNYLVFFNESTYSVTGSSTTTYYVPSKQSVNVTLTLATKTTTATE